MSYSENNPHIEELKIVFSETVVGTGSLKDGVLTGEITPEGLKHLLPDYDPTAGLSIGLAETPERPYVLPEHMSFDDPFEDITFPALKKGTFGA